MYRKIRQMRRNTGIIILISSEWHPKKQTEKTEHVLIPRKGTIILYWRAEQSEKMSGLLILHFNMAQKKMRHRKPGAFFVPDILACKVITMNILIFLNDHCLLNIPLHNTPSKFKFKSKIFSNEAFSCWISSSAGCVHIIFLFLSLLQMCRWTIVIFCKELHFSVLKILFSPLNHPKRSWKL